MVAPMSGHYATLLRGTVRDMLPDHDVYITDWIDARDVPLALGEFDLDDYTDYLIEMIEHLSQDGERIAVMAVCQPGIPAMAAASLMAMARQPAAAGVAGADGLADGHRAQPQAAERARAAAAARLVREQRRRAGALAEPRASCGGSIRASCSSRAFSR